MKKYIIYLICIPLFFASCDKEFTNPGSVDSERALTSDKALTALAIGLQRTYVSGRLGSIFNTRAISGFTSNEIFLLNAGNIPELQLSTGGNSVDGTNSILTNLWTTSNKIIYDADLVITGASGLGDKGYASGLIAYVTLFKALSIGNMATFWEKVPSGTGQNVTFIDRIDGYKLAITAIDKALAANTANPISAGFTAAVPANLNLINTLTALKARYLLFSGDYNNALTVANGVDLTKPCLLAFDATTLNPIFEVVTSTNNVYQPTNLDLGLPASIKPDANDKRIPFYTSINATIAPPVRLKGFFDTATRPIPLILPGEITLIKAEANVRKTTPNLLDALIELNKVITKTPASDAVGVGADLPLLSGLTDSQLLEQIYKNRCIELYQSGLKLEDMRRFNRPTSERKRNFFPYPFKERDNNPNTPTDPVF
ncbi:MAG TPA: RagB/SusD family protein [Pelobium sp.]